MSKQEIIEQFSPWQKQVLGAALVERMVPNYVLFSELTDSDGAQVYTNIIQLVWECCLDRGSSVDFLKQQDKLERITPDPKNYDMYGVWPALDACVGLDLLLGLWIDEESSIIESLLHLYFSTIDSFVQLEGLADNAKEENPLFGHPLRADADSYLETIIDKLTIDTKNYNRACVVAVKALAQEAELSNIGLSLTQG